MVNTSKKKIGLGLLLLIILGLASIGQVYAQTGETLYSENCANAGCHGPITTHNFINGTVSASDIISAINGGVPAMNMSSLVNLSQNMTDIQAIADAINAAMVPVQNPTIVANPTTMTVGPGQDAVYELNITNMGNATDTFNLTVDAPNGVIANLSVDSISIDPNATDKTILTVSSETVGTFTVNVTATSENTMSTNTVSTETIVETTTPPSFITVTPSNMTVVPGENATYSLEINNTGNASDTFSLTVVNPDGANVNLSQENVTLNASETGSTTLMVSSETTGTFTVNVTATSEATANSSTVSTMTIVQMVTPPPSFLAVTPVNLTVGPGQNATYNIEINNTANETDTFDLVTENPNGANVSLSQENVTVNASGTGSATLMVSSETTGTFAVNVTAKSRATNNTSTMSTMTTVQAVQANSSIESLTVGNGNRSGSILANVSVKNADTMGHWFAIVVSGTSATRAFPIVGTGTIFINANTTASLPVLVTIPTTADVDSYNMFAGLYNFDSQVLSPSNLIGSAFGPQVSTVS